MIYCFDIDGTICDTPGNNYESSVPFTDVIGEINRLYDAGHTIKMFTARGAVSGKDWTKLTLEQLNIWGVKHHELIMNKKPHYDVLIDDKAISAMAWRKLI